MFLGAMTALATPFRDGQVDHPALASLVERQIRAGIDGLVPCGTTGESPTLEPSEQQAVIRTVVEAAQGRVPVIAGAGSNSTHHCVALARAACAAGADGLLVVTPYYNRPTQEGLVRHFLAVAQAVDLPIIVYNIPGRTGCDLSIDSLERLAAESPRVVALKEATGSVGRAQETVRRLGHRIAVFSGDDALNLPIYSVGGRGTISVLANVAPQNVADTWDAAARQDFATAHALHADLLDLMEALFLETNPIPVKTALAMMGLITDEIRLPLCAMSAKPRERLRAVLARHGLVEDVRP